MNKKLADTTTKILKENKSDDLLYIKISSCRLEPREYHLINGGVFLVAAKSLAGEWEMVEFEGVSFQEAQQATDGIFNYNI